MKGALVLFFEPSPSVLACLMGESPLMGIEVALACGSSGHWSRGRLRDAATALKAQFREFEGDSSDDIRAHIKDIRVLCNGSRKCGAAIARVCVELGVHYVDDEEVDVDGVFESATDCLQAMPTAVLTCGMGVPAALDCLAAHIRSKMCLHDLQKDPAPTLILSQSEDLLSSRQRLVQRGRDKMRADYMPFVMKNALKVRAQYGDASIKLPLRSDFRHSHLELNPFCAATFLAMLDSGIPNIESYVSRPKSAIQSSQRDVGVLYVQVQGTPLGARMTISVSAEEYAARMMIHGAKRLVTGHYAEQLIGFVTPSQLFGPDFAWQIPGTNCSFCNVDTNAVRRNMDRETFPWVIALFFVLSLYFVFKFVMR